MKLSASQAAKAANVSGSTIGRAIKSGKLSASPTEDGAGWLIEPAELDRWRSNRAQGGQSHASQPTQSAVPQDREIALLREMLDEMRQRAERAETRAESEARHWRELAEKQSDQLAAKTRLIEDLTHKQDTRSSSWWSRLRSKSKAA